MKAREYSSCLFFWNAALLDISICQVESSSRCWTCPASHSRLYARPAEVGAGSSSKTAAYHGMQDTNFSLFQLFFDKSSRFICFPFRSNRVFLYVPFTKGKRDIMLVLVDIWCSGVGALAGWLFLAFVHCSAFLLSFPHIKHSFCF